MNSIYLNVGAKQDIQNKYHLMKNFSVLLRNFSGN